MIEKAFDRKRRTAVSALLLGISASVVLADDRQACLNGDADPFDAIAACTRLIAAPSEEAMKTGDAYYHRGMAFIELEEWEHARIDFERSLEFGGNGGAAADRLRELEQDGRVTPRNR